MTSRSHRPFCSCRLFFDLWCHLVDGIRHRHNSAWTVRSAHDGTIYHVYFVTFSKAVRFILMAVTAWLPKLPRLSSSCIFLRALKFAGLSNGATSTANASQNDVFLGLINYVYLNVLFFLFCLCQDSSSALCPPPPLPLPPTPPCLSSCLECFRWRVRVCVLTIVWTVPQAKVPRPFLRVRI